MGRDQEWARQDRHSGTECGPAGMMRGRHGQNRRGMARSGLTWWGVERSGRIGTAGEIGQAGKAGHVWMSLDRVRRD